MDKGGLIQVLGIGTEEEEVEVGAEELVHDLQTLPLRQEYKVNESPTVFPHMVAAKSSMRDWSGTNWLMPRIFSAVCRVLPSQDVTMNGGVGPTSMGQSNLAMYLRRPPMWPTDATGPSAKKEETFTSLVVSRSERGRGRGGRSCLGLGPLRPL